MIPAPLLLLFVLQHPATGDTLARAILAAEDGRAATSAEIAVLAQGIASPSPVLRGLALRALGRLERPALAAMIAPALHDGNPGVRAEAATALAQAVHRQPGDTALPLLLGRLRDETDSVPAGAILRAIGRLQLDRVDQVATARHALENALLDTGDRRAAALRGLIDFTRRSALTDAGADRVAQLLRAGTPEERRLAAATLLNIPTDGTWIGLALADPDPSVRRLAALGTRAPRPLPDRKALIDRGLADRDPAVRYEALRTFGNLRQPTEGCAPLLEALRDPGPHVVLLATDLLGQGCRAEDRVTPRLDSLVRLPREPGTWHQPAHALLALARTDATAAASHLGTFLRDPSPWVRRYAVQAAGVMRREDLLHPRLGDPDPNVREEAFRALSAIQGHGADSLALAALAENDQYLVTAATSLKGSPRGHDVVPPALFALARVTAQRRETSRDPRLALFDRIEEFGLPGDSAAIQPYLADYDPIVAARAAALLNRWTGHPARANPAPLPRMPLPTPEELAVRSATIVLQDGDSLQLLLRPDLAPTNVARFVRMARAGWFDGLTFHRVVPNFVLQGGSPHANEYAGGDLFTRDEVGGSHLRGTVGISTRGRDTGDGQMFINLVDNLRLDADYTVIGAVIAGFDAMDRVLEGTTIAHVVIHDTGRTK